MGTWGIEDTQGLWAPWTGFGCSCTLDRVGGPYGFIFDLSTGRSCVGQMMGFSMGGHVVQS